MAPMDEFPQSKSAQPSAEGHSASKQRFKLRVFKKRSKNVCLPQPSSDRKPEVIPFEENLHQLCLAKAGQQLIYQEESLFGSSLGGDAAVEQEQDKLHKDWEALLVQVWLAVQGSLCAGSKELLTLKEAMQTVQQEEKQDERWHGVSEMEVPVWRPRQCRKTHDLLLHSVVEERMSQPDNTLGVEDLSSTLKKDICKMGKQVLEDLLTVVRKVKECYPAEFDVCNLYARLYHQAFSQRLMKIAESLLEMDDCIYLLLWVHDHYPNHVLGHKELEANIECHSLGALLPEEVLQPLEKQYLAYKQGKVWTWISTALKKEEEKWKKGTSLVIEDGYYITDLCIDVIQIIDGAMKEARSILGDDTKAQRIGCQLLKFLESYRGSVEEFLKVKHSNTIPVTKAVLSSAEQCKDYIVRCTDLFMEDMRTQCLDIMNRMEDHCQKYLLKIIHKDLKPGYRKIGTSVWLTEVSHMEVLLGKVEAHIEAHRNLKPTCLEALMARLHQEVVVEYVRRLMKKKLKLKDVEQQEKMVKQLCEDNERLQCCFTKAGSKEEWLSSVFQGISELMKLQDPESIKMEIATLVLVFPDLSAQHVSALLHLKPNLSSSHIKNIQQSMVETQGPNASRRARPFFSKVHMK